MERMVHTKTYQVPGIYLAIFTDIYIYLAICCSIYYRSPVLEWHSRLCALQHQWLETLVLPTIYEQQRRERLL